MTSPGTAPPSPDATATAARRAARRRRVLRWAVRLLLIAAIAVVSAGFRQGRILAANRTTVPLGLPTPVRIAVLSDTHIMAGAEARAWARRAVEQAMAEKPDAIVLTGDFVSSRSGIAGLPALFTRIRAPLGVFAVLGNHDHWADPQGVKVNLSACGVIVLDNHTVITQKGNSRLALVGVDDMQSGRPDWEAAFRRVPNGVPALLLSHNPDAALTPEGQRASLIISGHTHGGQLWLPQWVRRGILRVTGIGIPPKSVYGRAHPYGLTKERWGWVYVTSGVARGSYTRWYTQPEVAVLDLG